MLPFNSALWDTVGTATQFVEYKGKEAVKITAGSNPIVARNLDLSNGTIEFDVQPYDVKGFGPVAIYFRRQNSKESEYLYLRTKKDDTKRNNDDIQYAPVINGVLMFNSMSAFDGPAPVHNDSWNHVKLVVSGLQMRVYVNVMSKTVLDIPRLEANSKLGSIAFEGKAYFANVVVRKDDTEGLSPEEGIDYTRHDINYIRRWDVNIPAVMGEGKELIMQDLPKDTVKWKAIVAERRGMINLTRNFGSGDTGRYVWLKTTIVSAKDQVVKCQLGFCDEVYVFANRKLIYADKNQFGLPLSKFPDGCMNIDNATISIPLIKGDNELMIGVVNNFYSWGIMARMQNLNGITILQE